MRLISRRGPHFRHDRLAYEEISDPEAAARELNDAALLAINADIPAEQLLALLTRPEIETLIRADQDLVDRTRPLNGWRKRELIELIVAHLEAERIRCLVVNQFQWWTPLGSECLLVFRLLFFGNFAQDMTEFVLQDIGQVRYEQYTISEEDRLFSSRRLVDETLELAFHREELYLALEAGDHERVALLCETLPDTGSEPSLVRRRNRILNHCGRHFERLKDDTLALSLYARSTAPPARERTARIYERNGRHREALELCDTILVAPLDEEERMFAESFRVKLCRKLGLPAEKRKRIVHPRIDLTLPRIDGQRVEEAVLVHYHDQHIDGFYAENYFWQCLFGLTFWDIIFMPVRGAFFNPFQRGPHGMFGPRFRAEREAAVTARLNAVVEDPDWPDQVLATFDEKIGIANYFVHPLQPREQLEQVLATFSRAHLKVILDRFSRHPGDYKSGFPDLILFDGETGYRLVEVKGPGDQLQTNQQRWLAWFRNHEIPYAVARVGWQDS